MKPHRPINRLATLASSVFTPLLMPTYAMVVALWLTPMRILPWATRAWCTLGIFFITALIPAAIIIILIRTGRASDADLTNRKQRPLPFALVLLCYLAGGWYLYALSAPRWLVLFAVVAAIVVVVEMFISYVWKISAHLGAAGAMVGFTTWLALNNALIGDPLWTVSGAILVAGILGWARLVLRRHTLMQLFAGAALGFGCTFLVFSV